ncbi:MAG: cytochrome c peroxidase [Bacteroidota bacterium]
MNKFLIFLGFLGLFWACSYDEVNFEAVTDQQLKLLVANASPDGDSRFYILPDGRELSEIPQDPKNPLSFQKITLGKFLFFETGIATAPEKEIGLETYSCSSCHIPSAGYKPGRFQGIADGAVGFGENGSVRMKRIDYDEEEIDAQGARPLSVLNVAFVENTSWNGQFGGKGVNEGTESLWNEEEMTIVNELGFAGIESQNIEGMELHRFHVDKEVTDRLRYTNLFDLSFPEISEDQRYSNFTASLAISAYIRSLITNEAPFQEWLKGDKDALTYEQKRGAALFFGKANCSNCHKNQNLGSNEFYALGVNDLYQLGALKTGPDDRRNLGRGGFTKLESDNYKFKVPQLYNMKGAPFYFHGSSKESLEEVIDYFSNAEPENPNVPEGQISPKFLPLNLSDREKADLLAFLEDALFDPNIDRYVPLEVRSGNCFPNNDELSKEDLNCN